MNVIELTTSEGRRFLYDFDSGWEVYDKGDKAAQWSNCREGRNLDTAETYAVLRAQLLPTAATPIKGAPPAERANLRLLEELRTEIVDNSGLKNEFQDWSRAFDLVNSLLELTK